MGNPRKDLSLIKKNGKKARRHREEDISSPADAQDWGKKSGRRGGATPGQTPFLQITTDHVEEGRLGRELLKLSERRDEGG